MNLPDLRAAIVAGIRETLPEAIRDNCRTHGGRFDKGEIKRIAMKSPAILVACLGLVDAAPDGAEGVNATFAWGAFVVTTDKPQLPRDAGALALVSILAGVVPDNRWGCDDAGYPDKIRGDNLYSGAVDGAGIALWAVTWNQRLTLAVSDGSALGIFATFHADWDLAPADGAIDAVDHVPLEQP